jgi:hypothetical protein
MGVIEAMIQPPMTFVSSPLPHRNPDNVVDRGLIPRVTLTAAPEAITVTMDRQLLLPFDNNVVDRHEDKVTIPIYPPTHDLPLLLLVAVVVSNTKMRRTLSPSPPIQAWVVAWDNSSAVSPSLPMPPTIDPLSTMMTTLTITTMMSKMTLSPRSKTPTHSTRIRKRRVYSVK